MYSWPQRVKTVVHTWNPCIQEAETGISKRNEHTQWATLAQPQRCLDQKVRWLQMPVKVLRRRGNRKTLWNRLTVLENWNRLAFDLVIPLLSIYPSKSKQMSTQKHQCSGQHHSKQSKCGYKSSVHQLTVGFKHVIQCVQQTVPQPQERAKCIR